MDRGAWRAIQSSGVTKSQTWLRDYDFSSFRIYTYHIYIWASLVAQMVKCLPTMQETWVWSLGREDPLEARVLEWVAISFSRGSSWPRDWTWVSLIVGRHFTVWATREAHIYIYIICIYHEGRKVVVPWSCLTFYDPHGLYIAHQAPLSIYTHTHTHTHTYTHRFPFICIMLHLWWTFLPT